MGRGNGRVYTVECKCGKEIHSIPASSEYIAKMWAEELCTNHPSKEIEDEESEVSTRR